MSLQHLRASSDWPKDSTSSALPWGTCSISKSPVLERPAVRAFAKEQFNDHLYAFAQRLQLQNQCRALPLS